MTERGPRVRILAAVATAALLAACGGDPASRADLAAAAEAARQPAELAMGEFTVRASLAPTASLSPGIARHYGVEPRRDVHLLLVGVRRGPLHDEASVPAQVSARARDLRGVWQDVPMHEVRSEDFIDYVGTARVPPPDTLAFEVTVHPEGAPAPGVLRFSRDLLPP